MLDDIRNMQKCQTEITINKCFINITEQNMKTSRSKLKRSRNTT